MTTATETVAPTTDASGNAVSADAVAKRIAKFWARVDFDGPVPAHRPDLGPCHIWTGGVSTSGYGAITFFSRKTYAHRVAYELMHGSIPEGLFIDHLCRTPLCVNARHHEAVTNGENVRRGNSPTMIAHRARTCGNGHEYTPENTLKRKGEPNSRICRTCTLESARRRWAARYVPIETRKTRSDCPPCGTWGGYRRHIRRKESICTPCREAGQVRHLERKRGKTPAAQSVNDKD